MKEYWLDYRINLIQRKEKRREDCLRRIAKKKHIKEKIQERKDKYFEKKKKRCKKN